MVPRNIYPGRCAGFYREWCTNSDGFPTPTNSLPRYRMSSPFIYLIVFVGDAPHKTDCDIARLLLLLMLLLLLLLLLSRTELALSRYPNRCLLYYALGCGCWVPLGVRSARYKELELLCNTRTITRVNNIRVHLPFVGCTLFPTTCTEPTMDPEKITPIPLPLWPEI